jgi:hypothetical protein
MSTIAQSRSPSDPTTVAAPAPDLCSCPQCGASAELLDRFELCSTEGPVAHARIRCLHSRHHFTMPAVSAGIIREDLA